MGITYADKRFSGTFQINNTGDSFGDAANTIKSNDPAAGYIPAYSVSDISVTYKISRYSLKAGINNLSDKAYFTKRTDEYPGPGIIPSGGRSFYAGISAKF